MRLHVTRFDGQFKDTDSKQRQPSQAEWAYNACLINGTLAPERTHKFIADLKEGTCSACYTQALNKSCEKLLCFDTCVSMVNNATHCVQDSVVIFPECCPGEENPPAPYRILLPECREVPISMPCPEEAPGVTLVSTTDGTPDTFTYVYTYVDEFGVESPPSPVSSAITLLSNGSTVELTAPVVLPAGACFIRFYKSSSSFVGNSGQMSLGEASFQLVDEVEADSWGGTFTYDGALCDIEFGTLLTSTDCPPPCMEKVVELENGHYAGFSCNEVYFSERHVVHNWPQALRITLPDQVKAIVGFDETLLVATTGFGYRITLQPLGDREQPIVNVQRTRERAPIASPGSMVRTEFGAAYASDYGLMAFFGNGTLVNYSRNFLNRKTWGPYIPSCAAWHNGRYFGFKPGGGGFSIQLQTTIEGGVQASGFVQFTDNIDGFVSSEDGRLYFHRDGKVYEWAAGDDVQEYIWKSPVVREASVCRPNAMKIVGEFGDPVEVTLFADGKCVLTKVISDSCPIRLPKMSRSTHWCFQLKGSTEICEAHFGPSIAELGNT